MIQATGALAKKVPVSRACEALGFPRSSLYRAHQPRPETEKQPRPTPPRALSQAEKDTVRVVLNDARFQDHSPRQVYATLLDEGIYHCSISTMYRVLHKHDEVHERRDQLQHPVYAKPELLATDPNQLWSWDITKLRGPAKWVYFYLYVILDVFSRYVVGWLLAEYEAAVLAEQLIAESCLKQQIDSDQLTLHADRGPSMRSKTVAQLLANLGIAKTHSRPYTASDNPFSESQFKTMKYRPGYPDRFGSAADARAWARAFFNWYNNEHRHSSLGLMTPAMVHHGRAPEVATQRLAVLRAAYEKHPERFVKGLPAPPQLPEVVWINPPRTNDGRDESP
jgi:putative transposase